MTSYYFPMALVVGGMLFYHLAQKSIPKEMNPLYATIVAYALGIVLCAIIAIAYPGKKSFVDSVKASNWAVFVWELPPLASKLVSFWRTGRVGK